MKHKSGKKVKHILVVKKNLPELGQEEKRGGRKTGMQHKS
jgi:hypothetical protein